MGAHECTRMWKSAQVHIIRTSRHPSSHIVHSHFYVHVCVHAFTFVCAPVCHVCQCVPAAWKSPHLLVRRSPVFLLTPSPLVLVLSTVLVFIFAAVFNPYKNVYEVR